MIALHRLTDDELLRHAANSFDELTSTDLEAELTRRLGERVAAEKDEEPLNDVLEQSGLTREDLPEIVRVMDEHYCDTPGELRAKLERANKFWDLAQDLQGDVLTRLADLINHCK